MMKDAETLSQNTTAKRKTAPHDDRTTADTNPALPSKKRVNTPINTADLEEQDFALLFDVVDDLEAQLTSMRQAAQDIQKSSAGLRGLLIEQETKAKPAS